MWIYSGEAAPTQCSLGLLWEITNNTFTFSVVNEIKPFTCSGVLSTVNSIFDPLGFLAPVTIQGRALLWELTAELFDWETPLAWEDSLQDLRHLHVLRRYTVASLAKAVHLELFVFSNVFTTAIGVVAYLKAV